MDAQSVASTSALQNLQEVLLAYLKAADLPQWPGTDGLTVRDILLHYPHAMAAGRVPSRKELLRKHPSLRVNLEAFFGEQ
jgi:hypothetical protein